MKYVLKRGSRLGMAGLGRNSNPEGALNTSMKGGEIYHLLSALVF